MKQELTSHKNQKKAFIVAIFLITLLAVSQLVTLVALHNPVFFNTMKTGIQDFFEKEQGGNGVTINHAGETIVENITEFRKEGIYFEGQDVFDSVDYFSSERERLIKQKMTFVDADLSNRLITIYKNGEIEYAVNIRAIASSTSWWQTPPGVFKARNKIEVHKSTFGNVFMPWNIPFQGNFFIHGWPYYPSGRPASSLVSGGCIRLSEEDAKKIFSDIPVGSPIIVHTDEFRTNFIDRTDDFRVPKLSTDNYFIANLDTNEVYAQGNHMKETTLGNIALLPLTLTAAEFIGIEKVHYAPSTKKSTAQGDEWQEELYGFEDSERINEGDMLRTYDFLFPALEDWSFEPLQVFGSYLGEEKYINVTNEKLASIGAHNSHVSNLIKRDPKNYSSPKDIFLLTKYVHHYRSFLLDISSTDVDTYLYGEPWLGNRRENPRIFPGFENFGGGLFDKVEGHTIARFEFNINGEKQSVFIGVFSSDDPLEDVSRIETALRTFLEG